MRYNCEKQKIHSDRICRKCCIEESPFTCPWAGEAVRLHLNRTPRSHCYYRHSGGDAAAGFERGARTRPYLKLFEQS